MYLCECSGTNPTIADYGCIAGDNAVLSLEALHSASGEWSIVSCFYSLWIDCLVGGKELLECFHLVGVLTYVESMRDGAGAIFCF